MKPEYVPLSQYNNPDGGMRYTLVAQCEVWYPGCSRPLSRSQNPVVGWRWRPIWGPGIFTFTSGGSFELGDEVVVPSHDRPPVALLDLPTKITRTSLDFDLVYILVTLAIIPWAPVKPAPIWLTTYKRPAPPGLA